eukprot:430978_1
MSVSYLVSVKQQLCNFVSNNQSIKYPFTLSPTVTYNTKKSFLDLIKSQNSNNAALIAFKLLPIYIVLPGVIMHEILSILTPQDRIELSHSCKYFRSLIISPRCLSDLWLYIYHIPTQKINKSSEQSSSMLNQYNMFVNTNTHANTTNANTSNPSPSHATSIPNTLASTGMSSFHISMFKTSAANSSSISRTQSLPSTPFRGALATTTEENNIISMSIIEAKCENDEKEITETVSENIPRDAQLTNSTNTSEINDRFAEITLERADDGNTSDTSLLSTSTDPLLSHPQNPVLTSKIIYWPNYKQVLSCDFPRHWKRRNSFYKNLVHISKHCGGAHIRVSDIGSDRLNQILSRISPMLLSLCFLNVRSINLDAYAFRCMNRLSYLAYQYIDYDSILHIPSNIVALEFTSCSFSTATSFMSISNESVCKSIRFLQICNCRFSNYSFQRLLTLCSNVVHISITTSSWNGTISLPSSLCSIIWRHNDGDFTISECSKVWEVALTINDCFMIEQLQNIPSLKQLVIATPLFKGEECLEELESNRPWLFQKSSHQSTPYYNPQSPSLRSISHISLSPSLPDLNHRLNKHSFNNNSPRVDLRLSPVSSVKKEISRISLDSDDEEHDVEQCISKDNDETLKIVVSGELVNTDWFKSQFIGEHIKFCDQRLLNPKIQKEFNKLNPIFLKEMKRTTHMFLIYFPFF